MYLVFKGLVPLVMGWNFSFKAPFLNELINIKSIMSKILWFLPEIMKPKMVFKSFEALIKNSHEARYAQCVELHTTDITNMLDM